MKIKKITPEIWDEIRIWYKDSFIIDVFASMDTGFVVERDNRPIASGFLILTNAKFVLMEHLQVNPKMNKITSGRGILALVAFLEKMSISLGYKCILGFTPDTNTSIRKMHQKVFKAVESPVSTKIMYKMI